MEGIVNLLARDTTNHTKPLTVEETERLTHRGLRLAQFTVAYNLVERVIAPTAGILGRVGPGPSGSGSTRASNRSPRCWSAFGSPGGFDMATPINAKND